MRQSGFQAAVSRVVACTWLLTVWAEWDDEMRLGEGGEHTNRKEALRHARTMGDVYDDRAADDE